jgi:Winged helix-turn helix
MNVRYRVDLSQAEREELTGLLSGGKHAARKLKRAQILLAADAGVGDEDIALNVGVGGSTVYRTKRRFVEGNLEAALNEEPGLSMLAPPPATPGEAKLTGTTEFDGQENRALSRAGSRHDRDEALLQLLCRGEIAADAHLSSVARNPIPTGRRSARAERIHRCPQAWRSASGAPGRFSANLG